MGRACVFAIAMSIVFLIAGCDQDGGGSAKKAAGSIVIEPAQLEACKPAAMVTVTWDLTQEPGVKHITILVGDNSAGPWKPFAEGNAKGSQATGPWAGPGMYFLVRNKESGRDLLTASVGSLPCQKK